MSFEISSSSSAIQNALPLMEAKQPATNDSLPGAEKLQNDFSMAPVKASTDNVRLMLNRYLASSEDKLCRGNTDLLTNPDDANDELEYHLMRQLIQQTIVGSNNTRADGVLSGNELIEKHMETIRQMKISYLQVFSQAFDKMSEFYKAFVKLKGELSSYLSPGPKEGELNFKSYDFGQEVKALIDSFSGKNGQLFPQADADGKYGTTTQEIARNWIEQLGLSSDCLQGNAQSGYWVQIDLKPLQNITKTLNDLGTGWPNMPITLNNAKYNAWESGFYAHADGLQSNMNLLTQKTSNASSAFDQRVLIMNKFTEQEAMVRLSFIPK